ncbi:hypothetical protein [Sphingomonas sp. CROZ-RG-20F-R02-07]|uniref:hypothetical protein n=1 Tax=Sphingomonas sp. CROZ-RG-20F-R02-07 TaxID=2914832 RepID=UPI001F57047F|nr:hypothetical protein [Sphingomonas sp. CROZ-RG-20F-R02-07]
MRTQLTGLLVAALALSACHKSTEDTAAAGNAAVAAGFVPPEVKPATPLPGQTQTTPITAYVGHYPSDAVDGVAFFDRTEVASALNGAVIDPKVRRIIVNGGGPQTPIFADRGRIASWGCEAHDCGDHDWTLFVDPKTRKGEACYHDAATMGATSRWYAGAAPATRAGDCPSGDGAPRDPARAGAANGSAAAAG